MKIGILTYHRAHNYGAMLQAYALKTVLAKEGYHVDFIDYWPKAHQRQYQLIKPLHGKSFANKIINLIVDCLTLIRRSMRMHQFNRFAEKYLGLTSHIAHQDSSLLITKQMYDYVIVGSDQIWRNYEYEGKHVGFDPVYFCQNTSNDVQCISYAASMGIININQQERNTLTQYLTAFDTILVRENSLKELINSLAIEAEVVVDPTLLLTKDQWNELLPSTRYRKQKYVLYYELIKSPEAMAFAIKQAKALNCKLLVMDSSIRTIPRKNHIAFASPIEFMHAIRDAEYIVATSFHGTAFSIIFEKQFITIGLNKNSDRVQTLLRHLDIEEHYQHHPTNVSAIKYDETSTVLHKIKTQSKQLLLAALTKN